MPLFKQRNPQARQQAMGTLEELSRLGRRAARSPAAGGAARRLLTTDDGRRVGLRELIRPDELQAAVVRLGAELDRRLPRRRPAGRSAQGQRSVPGRRGPGHDRADRDRLPRHLVVRRGHRPGPDREGPRLRHLRPRRRPRRGHRRHRPHRELRPRRARAGASRAQRRGVRPARQDGRVASSPCPLRFVGFSIPDEFVLGYGMDFAERYRNLDRVVAGDLNALLANPDAHVHELYQR